jgi:MFS family permease
LRNLLRDKNFKLLLTGQTLTMFGDVVLFLVLAIWVKSLTGSSGAAGAVFLFFTIPALVAPFAGLFIDRFPRRWVMILNDIATGFIVLGLLFVHDRTDVWIIYVIAFLYGASQQIFFAARSGLLVSMLEDEKLGDANGLLEALRQGLHIAGPLIGAAMFAVWGGGSVAVLDSVTFFLSAFFLSIMRVSDLERGGERPRLLDEISAGARHIWSTRELRVMVTIFFICLATIGMINSAFFSLIDRGLHRPPEFVGVIGTFQGAGSVLGGVLSSLGIRRFGESIVAAVGLVITGLGLAFCAVGTMPTALSGAAIVGVGFSSLSVGYMTLLQRRTTLQLQGRVFAASEAVLAIPMSLSAAVGVALVTVIGFRFIYGLNAVVMVGCGVAMYKISRDWRNKEGDALPGSGERIAPMTTEPLFPKV